MTKQDKSRIFLIVSGSETRRQWLTDTIGKHISGATVYAAADGLTAISKIQNAPPAVVVTDVNLPKVADYALVDHVLKSRTATATSVVILSRLPANGMYLDQIVTGRVCFAAGESDEADFASQIMKALTYSSHQEGAEYHMRFLAPGDQLIQEGDKGKCVYFVHKGRLEAYRVVAGAETVLGTIEFGEFVGEMAFINGEPCNASVRALENCELIEVPFGTFEQVLYKRPAWSKALMLTLAKRVKAGNMKKGEAGG